MRPFITSDINPTTMSHALARQCSSALFHVPSGQVPLVMGTSSTPEKPSGSSPHSAATKGNVMHCGEIKADNLYVSHPDKRIEVKNCCSMFSFYKRRQLLQRQADIKQNAQDYTLRWQHPSESIHAWRQRPPQQAFPLTVANPGSLPNPATAFTICSKHSTSPKRLLRSPAFKIFTVFTKFWKHHKPLLNC